MKNYYKILGLDRNATTSDIRSAYKNMALKYHPDRNKDGEERFKLVSEAYQVLIDPILKKKYDLNQSFIFDSKDPNDIWKSFFPNYISDDILSNIIKNVLHKSNEDSSFDLLYKLILDKFKKQQGTKTSDSKSIYINVLYDIQDHYDHVFNKVVYVDMTTEKKTKRFVYNIDTRINKHLFVENCNNVDKPMDTLNLNINLNVYPNKIDNYQIIDHNNLLYKLGINLFNYNNGFYLKHNLFGKMIIVYFSKPIESNLLYYLPGYGVPVSKSESGDLYFQLIIDNSTQSYSPLKTDKVINANKVNFFQTTH